MQIEIDENTSIASVIIAIALAVSSLIMFGCHQVEETKREAIRSGLVEKQLEGAMSTHWTKP